VDLHKRMLMASRNNSKYARNAMVRFGVLTRGARVRWCICEQKDRTRHSCSAEEAAPACQRLRYETGAAGEEGFAPCSQQEQAQCFGAKHWENACHSGACLTSRGHPLPALFLAQSGGRLGPVDETWGHKLLKVAKSSEGGNIS
jgi:hypothetical protein